MKSFFSSLVIDESAQGATEYILMLVIVVAIAAMFKDKILEVLKLKTDKLGEEINSLNP